MVGILAEAMGLLARTGLRLGERLAELAADLDQELEKLATDQAVKNSAAREPGYKRRPRTKPSSSTKSCGKKKTSPTGQSRSSRRKT